MARSVGGGGGGGHSSGGGRSFGGSSFGGSRSFGGSSFRSSSTRHVSSGSSYRSSRPSSSFHMGGGMPPPPPSYRRNYYRGPIFISGGNGQRYVSGQRYNGAPGGSGSGCGAAFLVVLIIVLVLCFFGAFARYKNQTSDNYGSYETSGTSNKGWGCEKYTGTVDSSRGYWADESTDGEKWIDNSNRRYLEEGFGEFYDKTGVFPYLYIVNSYGDRGDFATYEEKVYADLFGDCPGNLLFVFISQEESYYIAAGTGTGSVINSRTVPDVIQSKLSSCWYNSKYDNDLAKIFGAALSGSATLLMKEADTAKLAKNNFKTIMIILIIAIAVILIIILLMYWWKKKKQKQQEEDERLEKILSQPLSTFASTELNQLGQQYMNNSVPPNGNTQDMNNNDPGSNNQAGM